MVSLWLAGPALAHKGSDAYLQIKLDGAASTLRLDVALRDLDAVIDIDADANGKLTWGEVRAAYPGIERYLASRVVVDGCQWQAVNTALERRADGVYAALTWPGSCATDVTLPTIRYSALREIDPTHRAIAKIERPGSEVVVRVLDPTKALPVASPNTGAPAVAPESIMDTTATGSTVAPMASDSIGRSVVHSTDGSASASLHAASAAPAGFVKEGLRHIVGGYDHVLFLLCLLLPAVMLRTATGWQPVARLGQAIMPVVLIVTAFTVAHSVTLTLASLKLLSLPSSFIEPAIAVTIVLAALDNLVPIFRGRRAVVTFVFGLIHGFGFASVLGELELPTAQFAWSLFQFNLGIELGQLCIVVVAVTALFAFRHQAWYPTGVIRGGSVVAMAIGTLWFLERTANLAILPF